MDFNSFNLKKIDNKIRSFEKGNKKKIREIGDLPLEFTKYLKSLLKFISKGECLSNVF